ncbi:rubrerythrin [bacterium]|nr:rubrerythrin [bacterium]
MVEKTRCRGCGYFHVGPVPDHCPVCGSPASMFIGYEGPGDLAGTKTLENLEAAFAGESQANRTYTLFRRIAELEGAPASVLEAFDRAAREETAHALGQLAYMGRFGDTRANLTTSARGEDHECSEMYPTFAETAENEGLPEIAFYFRSLGRFEKEHRDGYNAAIEDLPE